MVGEIKTLAKGTAVGATITKVAGQRREGVGNGIRTFQADVGVGIRVSLKTRVNIVGSQQFFVFNE